MLKKAKIAGFLLSVIIFLSGCVLVQKGPQLRTLRELEDSQRRMELYIQKKEANLKRLLEDIEENRLQPGLSYGDFISSYGRPVLEKSFDRQDLTKELLYRRPTQYFNTKKVYLYFDQNLNLSHWQLQLPN